MSTEPAHLPPRPGCWRGIRGGAACAGASEPYGTRRRHEADAQRARLARWRSARRRTRPPQRPAPPANARVARREDPGPSTSRAFTARSAEVQTSISSRGCKATGPLTPARTSRHAAQRPGQRGRRVSRRGPRPARTFTALEQSSLCEGTVMSARADSSPPLSWRDRSGMAELRGPPRSGRQRDSYPRTYGVEGVPWASCHGGSRRGIGWHAAQRVARSAA